MFLWLLLYYFLPMNLFQLDNHEWSFGKWEFSNSPENEKKFSFNLWILWLYNLYCKLYKKVWYNENSIEWFYVCLFFSKKIWKGKSDREKWKGPMDGFEPSTLRLWALWTSCCSTLDYIYNIDYNQYKSFHSSWLFITQAKAVFNTSFSEYFLLKYLHFFQIPYSNIN